jgi:hypothetical protein
MKMAKCTARDLVRIVRTGRQFFLQIAAATGCDCVNGFGITMKRVKGKKTKQPAIVFYVNRKLSLRNLPVRCAFKYLRIRAARGRVPVDSVSVTSI